MCTEKMHQTKMAKKKEEWKWWWTQWPFPCCYVAAHKMISVNELLQQQPLKQQWWRRRQISKWFNKNAHRFRSFKFFIFSYMVLWSWSPFLLLFFYTWISSALGLCMHNVHLFKYNYHSTKVHFVQNSKCYRVFILNIVH